MYMIFGLDRRVQRGHEGVIGGAEDLVLVQNSHDFIPLDHLFFVQTLQSKFLGAPLKSLNSNSLDGFYYITCMENTLRNLFSFEETHQLNTYFSNVSRIL